MAPEVFPEGIGISPDIGIYGFVVGDLQQIAYSPPSPDLEGLRSPQRP